MLCTYPRCCFISMSKTLDLSVRHQKQHNICKRYGRRNISDIISALKVNFSSIDTDKIINISQYECCIPTISPTIFPGYV